MSGSSGGADALTPGSGTTTSPRTPLAVGQEQRQVSFFLDAEDGQQQEAPLDGKTNPQVASIARRHTSGCARSGAQV